MNGPAQALPLLLALLSCASSPDPEQVSLRMVQAFELGARLPEQGMYIARHTQTYAMIVAQVGADPARELVGEELIRSAGSRRAEWDRILALSYLDHFLPEELESITREGKSSPFARKLGAEHRNVQASVNARGKNFFTAYVTEALSRAFERSTGEGGGAATE